jgi:hypothetical protein
MDKVSYQTFLSLHGVVKDTGFEELQDSVGNFYSTIWCCYDFYAAHGGNNFRVQLEAFVDMVVDCGIADEGAFCNIEILKNLFKQLQSSNGAGLSRCQFLELVVQMGAAKFYDSGVILSLPDAVSKLCSVYLVVNLHPSITEDRDRFRRDCLYTEEVHDVVTADREVLQAVFIVFCGEKIQSSKPRLRIDSFVSLATKLAIIEPESSFLARHARLAFTMCKLHCVDDLKSLKTITFTDFIEALCRCAKEKLLPTDQEIRESGHHNIVEFLKSKDTKAGATQANPGKRKSLQKVDT